jgi:hypothetical protein
VSHFFCIGLVMRVATRKPATNTPMPNKLKSRSPTNGAEKRVKNAARRRAQAAKANVEPAAFKLEESRHYLGGLSIPTMHRLMKRGLLRPCRNVRHLLFSVSELNRFLNDGMS